MKKAILLVTWAGTAHWAKMLLENASLEHKIVVAVNEAEKADQAILDWLFANYETLPIEGNRWEVGGLEAMLAFTQYDEWVLIQDTLEITDPSIFDTMLSESFEGKSLFFGPGGLCYFIKYRREILSQFMLPVCLTKMDAFYYEHTLPKLYAQVAEVMEGGAPQVLFPNWTNDNPLNWKQYWRGRDNLCLYNEYVIKRKSLEWRGPANFRISIDHI